MGGYPAVRSTTSHECIGTPPHDVGTYTPGHSKTSLEENGRPMAGMPPLQQNSRSRVVRAVESCNGG